MAEESESRTASRTLFAMFLVFLFTAWQCTMQQEIARSKHDRLHFGCEALGSTRSLVKEKLREAKFDPRLDFEHIESILGFLDEAYSQFECNRT